MLSKQGREAHEFQNYRYCSIKFGRITHKVNKRVKGRNVFKRVSGIVMYIKKRIKNK